MKTFSDKTRNQGCQVVMSKKGQINPLKKPNSTEKTNIRKTHNDTFKTTNHVFHT